MDAAEMLPRIAVAPGGQSGSWGDFDKAFETPVEDLLTIIPKDIDPQGLFKALLAPQYLQGPPAPQQEVVPEPGDDMVHVVTHGHGPIERLYEAEFLRLEAGLEEGMEHVDALQLHINSLGPYMNTATLGPFIVPTPGITGTAGPTLSNMNLVVSTLEPIHEQERAPQQDVVPEPGDDMVHVVTYARGLIERLHEAEFLRLEAGLEEGMEHVDALQLHINPLGTDMNTATLGPFIVPTPGITGTAGPTLSNANLVVSTLEPIHEQERTSSGESPGGYRANLEHSSYSESFNAASSSSDSPQH